MVGSVLGIENVLKEVELDGGVHDNPRWGLEFVCCFCRSKLSLHFQGRSPQEVVERARQRGWTALSPHGCFCPQHSPGRLPDVVLIIERQSSCGYGFQICYFRFKSEAEKNLVLAGRRVSELQPGRVLVQGEIKSSRSLPSSDDPRPLEVSLSNTLDQAVNLAKIALETSDSQVRSNGFHPLTPIFLWAAGKTARFVG
jgi:hypothetical protein